MSYTTEQEAFWAGEFGSDYIGRNQGEAYLAANLDLFAKALTAAQGVGSCIEFGANIGMNLKALRLLHPSWSLAAVEINPDAVRALESIVPASGVHHGSMLEYDLGGKQWDLTLSKGVLIHIDPDSLPRAYGQLYEASRRYILLCEYYNPQPVSLDYRGHAQRLFKRDFAGEMLDRYSDLQLVDYGFAYRRDPKFLHSDLTWFLLEKGT